MYMGCADVITDPELAQETGMKTCTFSVCFYARAGNCGMGNIDSWSDHSKKIMEERSCGPCPGKIRS